MKRSKMENEYIAVMGKRSVKDLLRVLEASHEYVPEAVSAASIELHRRGVNAFEIAAAEDSALENEQIDRSNGSQALGWKSFLFWILFPFLAMTPIGTRQFNQFAETGHRRKSMQLLEATIIGFAAYALLLIGFRTVYNLIGF